MKTFYLFLQSILLFTCFTCAISCSSEKETSDLEWPEITSQTKPWTRWWWQGSAVTKEGITSELEAFKDKGFGGVEITPIYGVYGKEDQFIEYLSDQWMEMLLHTLQEADRLDLGVDMATGTGWPFGGPWVDAEGACKNFKYNSYEIVGGQTMAKKVEYIQEPFVRAVGNQIYEMHGIYKIDGQTPKGTIKEPLVHDQGRRISIDQLVEPLSANKNLQQLALDQVRFEKELPIIIVLAYSENGDIIDLTPNISEDGSLQWEVPDGNWTIYELFQGWHGKMVERAAPGGEGNVIDHFSKKALTNYLSKFDSTFQSNDIQSLRAFFNDSYEVDDARGTADWTPNLFQEFKERRGYELTNHLPALFGRDLPENNERILCDYRETISELIHDNFTSVWKEWAHKNGAIIRNQAHGSPSNILDLYAEVDIPEMEGNEPLRIKMASSASNVTGKPLTSSESATWLNEHFQSNLSDIKRSVDLFLLNGINHIFYHGTAYSPVEEEWPGWLFYAAVHVNDRNPLWHDFGALNDYIARSQSFLQQGQTDNDILLYYPIYDRFSTPGNEMIEHFDGVDRQFEGTTFKRAAGEMLENGYAFDYISDKQILKLSLEDGELNSSNNFYQTIIIPESKYIPLETFQKVVDLATQGAKVIFLDGFPQAISGFNQFEEKEKEYQSLIAGLKLQQSEGFSSVNYEKGFLYEGDNLDQILEVAKVRKESLTNEGLSFIRKKINDNTVYFINNTSNKKVDSWITLETEFENAVIYDPMSGEFGKAVVVKDGDKSQLYLQLTPQQTLILKTFNQTIQEKVFPFYEENDPKELTGTWKVDFLNGGPELPESFQIDSLYSWTEFSGEFYSAYSGTVQYELEFENPGNESKTLRLDLGKVKESAQVFINGKSMGTLIGPEYHLTFDSSILTEEPNILTIKVSNKMSNRIADLDKRGIFWKKFYNVNFPARLGENRGGNGLFTAENWEPEPSGLMGPVRIINLIEIELK